MSGVKVTEGFFFFPLLNQIGDELNTGAALYSTTAAFLSPRGDFLQGQQAVQYPAAQAQEAVSDGGGGGDTFLLLELTSC